MSSPMILDRWGRPFIDHSPPYQAASRGRELGSWAPPLQSADAAYLRDRDTIAARTEDMIRNHGLASGAVRTYLDSVIGVDLILSATPDYRVLGIDQDVAQAWSDDVESKYKLWASDNLGFYSDASRRLTQVGRLRQGLRSFLATGETVSMGVWRRKKLGKYRTCIRMLDSDRLSNPDYKPDTGRLRGGVQHDEDGAPEGYWFTTNHPTDHLYFQGLESPKWKFVPRETGWGRAIVCHIYDHTRGDQSRGISGFVSGIQETKMLSKFKGAHLQAAILNAIYAAVLQSPLPTEKAMEALSGAKKPGNVGSPLDAYINGMAEYYDGRSVQFDGVKIAHLFPGEEFKIVSSEYPSAAFGEFEKSIIRSLSASFGLSYEQLSRDYSETNYSSARASLQEVWRFFMSDRTRISAQQATFEYSLWLEEAIEIGEVVLPAGAPDFYEAKLAWCSCSWIGPGRQYIDPLKEAKADTERLAQNTTTLRELCANEQKDWRQVLAQKAKERQMMIDLGLIPDPKTAKEEMNSDPKKEEEVEDSEETEEDKSDE